MIRGLMQMIPTTMRFLTTVRLAIFMVISVVAPGSSGRMTELKFDSACKNEYKPVETGYIF